MRTDDPQTSFADLEFIRQGVHLDPLLQKISDFIDVHSELVELRRRVYREPLRLLVKSVPPPRRRRPRHKCHFGIVGSDRDFGIATFESQ